MDWNRLIVIIFMILICIQIRIGDYKHEGLSMQVDINTSMLINGGIMKEVE